MHISGVEAIPLAYPLDEAYGSARGTVDQRFTTLVRVEADDGTVGWGEAFGPPRTTASFVDELLGGLVIGRDPFAVGSLVEEVAAGLYHFGSSGLILSGVSGLDVALWDLRGRSIGRPVHELLGGTNRTTLVPYASTMYVREREPDDPASVVAAAVEEGFEAAKIKIGLGVEADRERVAAAREALGEDGLLMVDCNGNYRPNQAIRLAEAIEPYDVHWLEEPVPPEDLAGYRETRGRTTIPLAGGEATYGRWGFRRLLDERAVDVVQPDVCKCGGLTEASLITGLATTENAAVSPHCWTGAVGMAASLHYAATLPSYPHSTNVPEPVLFEVDRADNGLRDELLVDPIDPTGGTIDVPDGPGLGIEVDPSTVETYRLA